jgi:molecular chaperone DnaK
MLEESIEFAEQDFSERQLIEARNEAETILRATDKSLANGRAASLSDEERRAIAAAAANLRAAMAGSDYKLVLARVDELNQATQHLAEVMMNSALETALEGKRLEDV